jgi:hypothetical protein
MERPNHKKLKEIDVKEQYHVEISNRFAALENFDADVGSNRAWETIRENITISAKESLGYYEVKKHKPWVDEGCSKLLDQRKQAKLRWLQVSWRKLHNEELYNLRPAPSISRMIKSRTMSWAGHVAQMGEKRTAYKILVGKPEGKRRLGRQEVGEWIILKWILERFDGMVGIGSICR